MRNLTPGKCTLILGILIKVGIISNSVHGEKGKNIRSICVVYEFIFMFEKHHLETVKDTEWYDDDSETYIYSQQRFVHFKQ